MTAPWVMEPGRKVPVIRDVDVAVVGGGCAGVCAAVAAALPALRRAAALRGIRSQRRLSLDLAAGDA